ncbi:MAG: hypothetical protein GY940_21215 [bacterium]|nr:hypothetical protein [bacterium]
MKKGIFIIVAILFFLVSCGLTTVNAEPAKRKKSKTKSAKNYIFYPPLPNTPRFQYLTTFSNAKDVQKKKSKFFKFVAGADEEKPKEIRKAYGIDVYDGVVYVCDITAGAVVTLNLKRKSFGFIGVSGSGKLLKPVNIKIDKENQWFYVADIGRKQVLVFDLEGRYLRAYGTQGQFSPSDVDFFEDKLFVCDVRGHQVHVLDRQSGKPLYKIGKPGSKIGELFHPTNISIYNRQLYVSETNNFRVQLFDLKGKHLSSFGQIGDRPGDFSRNKGLAVDKEGRIYVVDSAFENLQVFNSEFKLLLFMLSPGPEKHNINLPAAVAVDYDNLEFFKKFMAPKFKAQYLVFVTSNYGQSKVNVYAFGDYKQ